MRVSVLEDFRTGGGSVSVLGKTFFSRGFFTVGVHVRLRTAGPFVASTAREAVTPKGKTNGNYLHGCRTKEMIEVWRLIKSLR